MNEYIPSSEEAVPPPSPILHGQLEVSEGDSDACSHNQQDQKDHEQNAPQLIGCMSPHRTVDVEQLNVDCTKNSSQYNTLCQLLM